MTDGPSIHAAELEDASDLVRSIADSCRASSNADDGGLAASMDTLGVCNTCLARFMASMIGEQEDDVEAFNRAAAYVSGLAVGLALGRRDAAEKVGT